MMLDPTIGDTSMTNPDPSYTPCKGPTASMLGKDIALASREPASCILKPTGDTNTPR